MKPCDEEALLAGLRALREKTADEKPPASVEIALLAEFRLPRMQNKQKSPRRPLLWVGLAAAAALLIAVAVSNRQPEPVVVVKTPETPKHVETVRQPAPPEPSIMRQVKRAPRRPPAKPEPVQEVATEFLPVPYAPVFTSEDRGQVVRVRLPRESMRSFGLPVNQDRIVQTVKADVLVGEDGIARAIRFVQ